MRLKMLHPNPAYVTELIEILRTSPFPSHMSMELEKIELDTATIKLNLGKCHLQPFGIVHGGVLATLIDTATFWSVFLRIPEDAGLVNVDLKLNYLRPVTSGQLKAQGIAIKSGKSISYAEAKVFDADGELVAHGTSTLMALQGKSINMSNRKYLSY
jgi:uncharacterized protein (TIGR00369 family)